MSARYKSIVGGYYNKFKENGERVYNIDDVKKFVKAGKLTAEEYQEITGEKYAG